MTPKSVSAGSPALYLGVIAAMGIVSFGAVRAFLRPPAAVTVPAPAASTAAATASAPAAAGTPPARTQFQALVLDSRTQAQVEAKVDRYVAGGKLTPVEARLATALGDGDWGRRMLRLYLIPNHPGKFGEGSETLTYNYLEMMSLDPIGARAYLNDAIHTLSAADFKVDETQAGAENARHLLRASLIVTASMVPELSQDANDLALAELGRTPSGPVVDPMTARTEAEKDASMSMTGEMLAPVMAYNILVSKAPSVDAAITATLTAFQAQPHFNVRLAMENSFIEHFPNDTARLSAALKTRGLSLPSDQVPGRGVASKEDGGQGS